MVSIKILKFLPNKTTGKVPIEQYNFLKRENFLFYSSLLYIFVLFEKLETWFCEDWQIHEDFRFASGTTILLI